MDQPIVNSKPKRAAYWWFACDAMGAMLVYTSLYTDNKNDVRCNARAFLTENKANPAGTFSMLL